jgi:hypothetical protein
MATHRLFPLGGGDDAGGMNETPTDGPDLQSAIDREVEVVMSAINLVASGGAPAATVGNLRLLDAVLEIVGPRARAAAVTLEPLWGPDETVTDVRIRRAAGTTSA